MATTKTAKKPAATSARLKPTDETPNLPATTGPAQGAIPGMDGEFDRSDARVPSLNIGQGMGDLEEFPKGTLIFDKDTDIGKKVTFIPVRLEKFFQEDLPYGSPKTPLTATSKAEVERMGGVLDIGATKNRWLRGCHATLLIRLPKGVEGMFQFNKESWTLVRYTAIRTSYSAFVPPLLTKIQMTLGNIMYTGVFEMTTVERSSEKNRWYVPSTKLISRTDDKFVKWFEDNVCNYR